jgi:hypothetical protein
VVGGTACITLGLLVVLLALVSLTVSLLAGASMVQTTANATHLHTSAAVPVTGADLLLSVYTVTHTYTQECVTSNTSLTTYYPGIQLTGRYH